MNEAGHIENIRKWLARVVVHDHVHTSALSPFAYQCFLILLENKKEDIGFYQDILVEMTKAPDTQIDKSITAELVLLLNGEYIEQHECEVCHREFEVGSGKVSEGSNKL